MLYNRNLLRVVFRTILPVTCDATVEKGRKKASVSKFHILQEKVGSLLLQLLYQQVCFKSNSV